MTITPNELSARVGKLSDDMLCIGELMVYYGGFGVMTECGNQLLALSDTLAQMAALLTPPAVLPRSH